MISPADPFRSPRVVASVILLLLVAQVALWWICYSDHEHALVDDAYISFRYASRWALGQGLTWNDGLRVEGFSNPLWTLGLGSLARAGIPPHRIAPFLGLAAALATTLVLLWAAARRDVPAGLRILVVSGVALDVGLAVWAGSGLETASGALLMAVFLAISASVDRGFRVGLGLGLAGAGLLLSRPEAILWVSWSFAWLLWIAWVPSRMLWGFLAGLGPALGYAVFRWVYFGRLLPNTFFAKLEPSGLGLEDGLAGAGIWILAHAVWILPFAVVGVGLARRRGVGPGRPGGDAWLWLPAGILLGQGLFVVGAGGDWMGPTRYWVPVAPALYLLAAEALRPVSLRGAWVLALATLALAVHVAVGWAFRDRIPIYTREGEEVGRWLRAVADSSDRIAVTAAGAIPYFSGLTTLDVLGINDPRAADRPPRHRGAWAPGHHRYDLEAMLVQEPEWIVWDFGVRLNRRRWSTYENWPEEEREQLDYRRELFTHRRFTAEYEIDTAAPRTTQGAYTVFRRRTRRPEGGR